MKRNIIALLLISVLSLSACGQSPEDARKELGQMNISYSEHSFIESAANGDMMAVKLFLAAGMNVNSENGLALVYAVQKGRTEIVETLLDAGADVNKGTSLIAALRQNQVEIVKILLDRGADVNVENGIALRIAADSGRTDLVKLLLDKGADVTLSTSEGETALMDAIREGHIEIVKLLLDKGANGADGGVLWVAIQNGRTELVNLLLDKGADANVKTRTNQTALMEAIRQGQPEIIKLLLDKGADANVKDQNNETALIMALKIDGRYNNKKNDIIKTLLEQAKGIDVNVKNFYGTPALFLSGSDIEIVKALIAKGADVNARYDRFGVTPLMQAARSGDIEIVKFLLVKGADINARDAYGYTALSKAQRHPEIIQLLKNTETAKEAPSQQQNKIINTPNVPNKEVKVQTKDQQTIQAPTVPIHKQGDTYTLESISLDSGTRNTTERKVILANSEKLVIESRNSQSKSGKVRKLEFTPEWNLIAVRNSDGSGINYSPPLKYYEFPLTSGKTWQQTSIETNIKTGAIREHTLSAVVGDWENVTVPAGTFRGVKVTIQAELVDRTTGQKTTSTDTSWYVPEVRRGVRSLTSTRSPEGVESRQDLQLIRYEVIE